MSWRSTWARDASLSFGFGIGPGSCGPVGLIFREELRIETRLRQTETCANMISVATRTCRSQPFEDCEDQRRRQYVRYSDQGDYSTGSGKACKSNGTSLSRPFQATKDDDNIADMEGNRQSLNQCSGSPWRCMRGIADTLHATSWREETPCSNRDMFECSRVSASVSRAGGFTMGGSRLAMLAVP